MELYDKTVTLLEKALELRSKRHALLASNIANSETPNYQSRELDFAGELQKALGSEKGEMARTHSNHLMPIQDGDAHIVFDQAPTIGADGNNVDSDVQMGKISTNATAYSTAASFLRIKLGLLRLASRSSGGGTI